MKKLPGFLNVTGGTTRIEKEPKPDTKQAPIPKQSESG